MGLVKALVILSVFITQIDMVPVLSDEGNTDSTDNLKTLLKLPKDIKPGTNITIVGNMDCVASFSATFSGDNMDKYDKCTIFFSPEFINKHTKVFNIKIDNQDEVSTAEYELSRKKTDVSFTLHGYAREYETNEGDVSLIELYFQEVYDKGMHMSIGACKFTDFSTLEYIVFQGVKHVENLSFNFTRP